MWTVFKYLDFCSQILVGGLVQAKISDPGNAEVLSIYEKRGAQTEMFLG